MKYCLLTYPETIAGGELYSPTFYYQDMLSAFTILLFIIGMLVFRTTSPHSNGIGSTTPDEQVGIVGIDKQTGCSQGIYPLPVDFFIPPGGNPGVYYLLCGF